MSATSPVDCAVAPAGPHSSLSRLEATLNDNKKKYREKVEALLQAWEHVGNFVARAESDKIESIIKWIHKHTLELVLSGEWPKQAQVVQTHLTVTVKKCAGQLKQHTAAPKCLALLKLVENPWKNPVLEKILTGESELDNEDEFLCLEKGELLTMRLKILCDERCQDYAVNLAAACVRSLRRERLRSLSDAQQVEYMIDIYIVLLFKLKRHQDIFNQLKLMEFEDSLELVKRLSGQKPTKYGTARVWKNSLKAAELVAQYLVTSGMVRPVADTGAQILEEIFTSWAMMHLNVKDAESTLTGVIRKLIEAAESAQHIYIFCSVILKHFGDGMRSLVIELYIRALTTDMNEWESQKTKNETDKARETAQRLGTQFLQLADVVDSNLGISRECVLTSFSLHPTHECFDRIKEIAIASGKLKQTSGDEAKSTVDVKTDGSCAAVTQESEVKGEEHVELPKTDEPPANSATGATSLVSSSEEQPVDVKSGASEMDVDKQKEDLPTAKDSSEQESVGVNVETPKEPVVEIASGELENSQESSTSTVENTVERTLDALILIKGDAVTGSANYDEKTVSNQVLDGEKLGIAPQLCDDLAVVLSSPRYQMLSWALDWAELSNTCEKYLENAEEMRNTNKELKFLNIDYSQFKDWPSDHEGSKDVFCGIEKGYEQWADLSSEESEENYGSFKPAGGYKRNPRRSIDDTSSDSDNSTVGIRQKRHKKVHRIVSSESEYDSRDMTKQKKHYRSRVSRIESDEDTDTNTQDSQTDSLGSDGCRLDLKHNKPSKESKGRKISYRLFNQVLNQDIHSNLHVNTAGSDCITLFSDVDEKCETIRPPYTFTLQQKPKSNPESLKSLRNFRKPLGLSKLSLSGGDKEGKLGENNSYGSKKFAPQLSTLNLSPKIVLPRAEDLDICRNMMLVKKVKSPLSHDDLNSELRHIQKSMPFNSKGTLNTYQKHRNGPNKRSLGGSRSRSKGAYALSAKEVAKNVPGMTTLDMIVPPRMQPTVNVVQLSRNIPQSPNSSSTNSGNTPPRPNRTPSIVGSIQLPGTPSSGGHDSGVGMSPADQTPPPRSSNLHDVGDEANQPPDNSPTSQPNSAVILESELNMRILTNRRLNQHNQSPKKSPSPSAAANASSIASSPVTSEQLIVYKPTAGGTSILASQRNVTTEVVAAAAAGAGNASNKTFERIAAVKAVNQLPKFQQAFGKANYTLTTTESTTGASTADASPAAKTVNLSKAVQTSVPSTQQSAVSTIVQSLASSIPNLQLTPGRHILIQSPAGVTSTNVTQTLTQLVPAIQSAQGVIYTQKMPVATTTSTATGQQINILSGNSVVGAGRTGVLKVNIVKAAPGQVRQSNLTSVQVLTTSPRLQQQRQQQQQQQQQAAVRGGNVINSPIEAANSNQSTEFLEQLREFESVFEQVKERSTTQPPPSHQASSNATTTTSTTTVHTQTTAQQTIKQEPSTTAATAVGALAQQLLLPAQTATANNATEFSSNGGNSTTFQSDVFQQKVSLTFTTNPNAATLTKVSTATPVVVVTSYCQPAASPALSVTSQSSSSPCVTPAPAATPSAGKTPATSPSSKNSKKAAQKNVKTSSTNTSKPSPIPKPQQKPQEDEQTAQRIYAILDEYAEQLRNSPDLNNKPAPRRRSNPPTNPSQSSKRKKSSSGKNKPLGQHSSELSPSTEDLTRTMGSEDSSSGIAHIQDSPASFQLQDEPTTNVSGVIDAIADTRTNTSESNDAAEVSAKRRLILTDAAPTATRTVIVQDAVPNVNVSEALAGKMGQAAVMIPGTGTTNYLLPVANLLKGQQFTILSSGGPAGTKILTPTAVRNTGTTTTNLLLQCLNQKLITQPAQVKQVKLQPTLQTITSNQQLSGAQKVQSSSIVIAQNNANAQFTSDSAAEKGTEGAPVKTESTTQVSLCETPTGTILINKSTPISLIQRNIGDLSGNPQICGVITSNPSITLQGSRLFNSTIHKLSTPGGLKTESVVCLAPTSAIQQDKKLVQESQANSDSKPVIQATTIALTFTPQSEVSVINNIRQQQQQQQQQQQKDIKDASMEIATTDNKVITAKPVKRKLEDTAVDPPKPLVNANSIISPMSLHATVKIEPSNDVNSPSSDLDNAGQFIVRSEANNINNCEDALSKTVEDSAEINEKIGNGMLCNAKLEEPWEPEHKNSPDTPWRYNHDVPTSTIPLSIEPLKVYSRDNDCSDNVLHIINKGQTIEMVPNSNKKYFINHPLDSFHSYGSKSATGKVTASQQNKEIAQQRQERKAAALEHQLRLQKSLSEECEDIGVDEPSTSDLFPDADLIFCDSNHSPAFDNSSQDASCSHFGAKSYAAAYFKPLDSSGSRDASPVTDLKVNERRKTTTVRSRGPRDSLKRVKRDKDEGSQDCPSKHIRLSPDNLTNSQDEASNSNSDLSRFSPSNLPMETEVIAQCKSRSRNGSSKEGTPSSVSSVPSNMKLEMDDSESQSANTNANNASTASSGDESLSLLTGSTADVTIPSPVSSVAGPVLSTHKYHTYSNKKRTSAKSARSDYHLSWESPSSERTRSSSDEEDSSVAESVSSQPEEATLSNGIDDRVTTPPPSNVIKSTTAGERLCTYGKKTKDKLHVKARVVLNRAESKGIIAKRSKASDQITITSSSSLLFSDKTSEASDEEVNHSTSVEATDCKARRSSLRGHVNKKKNCACCNGAETEPPKKKLTKQEYKIKKRLPPKQLSKKR